MKFYIDFDHTLYNSNRLISSMINSLAEYILKNGKFENYPTNFNKQFPNLALLTINKDIDSVTKAIKDNFKRPEETYLGIKYNIYSLIETFSLLFECDANIITNLIDEILDKGENLLYEDTLEFLKLLKSNNNNEVYILSHEKNDMAYQTRKILATKILQKGLIDAIIVTRVSKATLNAENYNNKDITCVTFSASNNNSGNNSNNTFNNDTSIKYTSNLIYQSQNEVDYEHGIFFDDRPSDLEALYESVYSKELPNIKSVRIFRVARPNGTYKDKPFSSDKYNSGIRTVISPLDALDAIINTIN